LQKPKSILATVVIVFSALSLAMVSTTAAAASITLTPTAQAPSGSLNVVGTGFGATKAVAIGLGAESSANDTNIPYNATPDGLTSSGRTSNYPIKPGSFLLTSLVVATGQVVPHTDNGNGTLSSPSQFFASGTINYATGQWSTVATVDISSFERVYGATYTRYQYNVTPTGGLTTNSSGAFTALVYVPAVANGNYNVTAMDAQGNMATATVNVNSAIPEVPSLGVALLLSSVAVMASSWHFRRRVKSANQN